VVGEEGGASAEAEVIVEVEEVRGVGVRDSHLKSDLHP
jgi:hypothetical protein